MERFRFTIALTAAALLAGCAPTYGGTKPKEPVRAKAPPKPKVLDLSNSGRPVKLGEEIEMKGYSTVWLEGTTLLVTLLKTRWNGVSGEGQREPEHDGKAKLKFEVGDKTKDRTIGEGDTKVVLGYKVSVSHAYEIYRDDGRWVPHVKFTVSK